MKDFVIISNTKALVKVDNNVYSQNVITKVLYWLSGDFSISTSITDGETHVSLESGRAGEDWGIIKNKVSTLFIDFKMREQIEVETKDIRTILYVKAFANMDDFTEYEC